MRWPCCSLRSPQERWAHQQEVGYAHSSLAPVPVRAREIRRQLDPNAVTLVRHGGRTLDDKELDSLTGYQIAHFGLCGIGALMLALTGAELVDSLWTAISVVSTFGPSPTMGAFGDADELGRLGQLVMIPGMLAGRLTILPLLLAVAAVQQGYRALFLGIRRLARPRR